MSALAEQHERWSGAKERLWVAPPRESKPPRERPVSPFAREIKAQREQRLLEHKRFLEQLVIDAKQSVQPWRQIVADVAKKHKVSVKDILGISRFRHIVIARQEAMWRVRNEIIVRGAPISLPEIGRRFGGRDHSTVIHSMRAHERRLREAANASN